MTASLGQGKLPQIKLLLIGESGVGKSCLLLRFAENTFTESYLSTIGIDFKTREVEIADQRCSLQVWDTAGQEQFRNITSIYYRGAHGIAMVYDITSRSSFENVNYWMKQIDKCATSGVCKILIGNKSDLVDKRMVQTSEGLQVAQRYSCEFYETSAKNGQGVEKAFMDLAKEVKQRQLSAAQEDARRAALHLQDNNEQSSRCRCA